MLKFFNSLFGRVVIALVVGIVIGAVYPHFAQSLRPLGDGFLKLIKMVIGPIVFCVVVSGMAHAGDLRKVGIFEAGRPLGVLGAPVVPHHASPPAQRQRAVGQLDRAVEAGRGRGARELRAR